MARKIQRKELRKPDEFIDVASRTLNWIADHRGALGIAIAATLVVIFGVMLLLHLRRNANVEQWRGLIGAVPVRAMPKDDSAAPQDVIGKQDPAVWVDATKMRAVADGAESDAARRLADLPVAAELLAQGDAAAAEQRYRAYLKTDPAPASAGRLVAQEGLGYALERQNKLDQAALAFAALGDLSGGTFKALALYHQGRLAAAAGHDDEARKLLLEAKSLSDPRPTDVVPRIESWLRVIELRNPSAAAPVPAPPPPAEPPALPPPAPAAPSPEDAGAGGSVPSSSDATAAPEQPVPAADAGAPQGDAPGVAP